MATKTAINPIQHNSLTALIITTPLYILSLLFLLTLTTAGIMGIAQAIENDVLLQWLSLNIVQIYPYTVAISLAMAWIFYFNMAYRYVIYTILIPSFNLVVILLFTGVYFW